MYKIFLIVLLLLLLIYEKLIRPQICEKKIGEYLQSINGDLIMLEKVSIREEIYSVKYKVGNFPQTSVVKFNFFFKYKWD